MRVGIQQGSRYGATCLLQAPTQRAREFGPGLNRGNHALGSGEEFEGWITTSGKRLAESGEASIARSSHWLSVSWTGS